MIGWSSALFLENGHLFLGDGFGAKRTNGGEAVFNTGTTGYQEIFTDPSYSGQLVTICYPHVGNTGVNSRDVEANKLHLSAVITRDYCHEPSSWRSEKTLDKYLEEANIPGISGIDTRALTRILRDEGAQRAVLFPVETSEVSEIEQKARQLLEPVPHMEGRELVSVVSCEKAYEFEASDTDEPLFAVYDFGVKNNILRHLKRRGFRVKVYPYNTPAADILNDKPVAVMLSNGPGDPGGVDNEVLKNIESFLGKLPVFAICMGHQLMGRTLGMQTFKLKFGHHGINHPVKDLRDGRILITSQNHGFAIQKEDVEKHSDVELSHINLNDHTVQGFVAPNLKLLSLQFHPEASPGPWDASYLFQDFVKSYLR